jgi:hypothetical protein
VQRNASVTLSLAVLMAILGPLLLRNVGTGAPILGSITAWNATLFVHVTTAFGIITQMAATAIANDVWEEKEFLTETRPGEVPSNPAAGRRQPTP